MKKLLFLLFIVLFVPISVRADHMYRVDMKIDILEDGSANITEIWDVDAEDGSEWYKQIYNLGNTELSNYTVSMDGVKLKEKKWDVDESLNEKKGYYGINYTNSGLELCFGKYDFDRHIFTLNYTLSNFIFNTNDSQILYWTLLPKVTVDDFSVEVTSYYEFPDTLDVWGYGYKGYAYVNDGKISMSDEGILIDDYVVLLVKFPLKTFKTSNTNGDYNSFNDVYQMAEEGSFEYDYDDDLSFIDYIIYYSPVIFSFMIFVIYNIVYEFKNGYGYSGNKKIKKKDVPIFRDIPCNKDIYYANTLIKLNNFGYSEGNIFGAIILKWIKEKKVTFKSVKDNENEVVIILNMNSKFDYDLENKLFNMMCEASNDGNLGINEFEKWCENNYFRFLSLLGKIENAPFERLKNNGAIYQSINSSECKQKNVMNDQIYNDSVELYGLKKYLKEFSRMDTKEAIEVKLWDEYLIFAYLLGIADEVMKQLKEIYPYDFNASSMMLLDYNILNVVDRVSARSVYAASSARIAAENYSSGGGGFSSGGGGGGSSGGGGSMGGR